VVVVAGALGCHRAGAIRAVVAVVACARAGLADLERGPHKGTNKGLTVPMSLAILLTKGEGIPGWMVPRPGRLDRRIFNNLG
jgi:hypothetical protein